MATIRKLRGRWQAMIRRKGMAPRAKSFDNKTDAERWARHLELELDRCACPSVGTTSVWPDSTTPGTSSGPMEA